MMKTTLITKPDNSQNLKPAIGTFERNLTWWVFGCIVIGITLGQVFPHIFQAIGRVKFAEVNLPVAVLIWLMIIPMLLKIDFSAMKEVLNHGKGIGVTY